MVESEESYTESGNRRIASYLSPKGTLAIPNKKSIKSSSCLSADYNVQNATKKGIVAYKQLRRFFCDSREDDSSVAIMFHLKGEGYHEGDENHDTHQNHMLSPDDIYSFNLSSIVVVVVELTYG